MQAINLPVTSRGFHLPHIVDLHDMTTGTGLASCRAYKQKTKPTMRSISILAIFIATATGLAAGPSSTIDATRSAGKVSPKLYGLMTEEINHSYDGGLYAELIRNRTFLDDAKSPANWDVV